MLESTFTSRLLKELRQKLGPGAVVLKHNDGMTKGIPDFSVTLNGKSSWFEVKLTTNKKPFDLLQMITLQKMRGDYIFWDVKKRMGDIRPAIAAPCRPVVFLPFHTLVNEIIKEVQR